MSPLIVSKMAMEKHRDFQRKANLFMGKTQDIEEEQARTRPLNQIMAVLSRLVKGPIQKPVENCQPCPQ